MATLRTTLTHDLDAAHERLSAALAERGFGVLTDLDLRAILRDKLGVEHEPHRILGVCNPELAKQALDVDRDVALLLPCTLTLRQVAGGTEVRLLDPAEAFGLAAPATRERLEPLAEEARARLSAALAAVEEEGRKEGTR